MEGYSVTEAASVLGVTTERVWELLARGILSGAPDGETGMRVFLQPRPAPAPPEPAPASRAPSEPERELSPFRELLTEFRNLTERYGQALLALGEARGEVASLRSRVDMLEARMDLRLPPPTAGPGWSSALGSFTAPGPALEARVAHPDMPPPDAPQAPSEAAPSTAAPSEPVAEPPAQAAPESPVAPAPASSETATPEPAPPVTEPEAEPKGPRRHAAPWDTEVFAEALARANDPSLPDLPAEAQAAPVSEPPPIDAELPREVPPAAEVPVADEEPIADELVAEELAVEELPPAEMRVPQAEPAEAIADEAAATEPVGASFTEADEPAAAVDEAPEPEADVEAGSAEAAIEPASAPEPVAVPVEPESELVHEPMTTAEREPELGAEPVPGSETAEPLEPEEARPEAAVAVADAPATTEDVPDEAAAEADGAAPEAEAEAEEVAVPAWQDERYTAEIVEPDWFEGEAFVAGEPIQEEPSAARGEAPSADSHGEVAATDTSRESESDRAAEPESSTAEPRSSMLGRIRPAGEQASDDTPLRFGREAEAVREPEIGREPMSGAVVPAQEPAARNLEDALSALETLSQASPAQRDEPRATAFVREQPVPRPQPSPSPAGRAYRRLRRIFPG